MHFESVKSKKWFKNEITNRAIVYKEKYSDFGSNNKI